MDGDKQVWVPHPTEGFVLGRIIDIGSDTITVDAKGQVSVPSGVIKSSLTLSFK